MIETLSASYEAPPTRPCWISELNPLLEVAHNNLGNLLKELGKLTEAEVSFRKAIEINPNFYHAFNNLGNLLKNLNLDQLTEAEIFLRKAIDLNPSFSDAYFNLSFIEL